MPETFCETFTFTGAVDLVCQEGGYADASILLGTGDTLDDVLAKHFATAPANRMGDRPCGTLRITVERADV